MEGKHVQMILSSFLLWLLKREREREREGKKSYNQFIVSYLLMVNVETRGRVCVFYGER